jgi:septal ring factor EnvC (AmiA/AmiB activator)
VNDAIDEVGELGTGVEVATAATTTRAARSTKAVKSAEPTKAAKATKATTKTTTRATKSTKAAKSAEPTKATKSTKATTRATKSTKAVKSAEPTKAAKATKATKTAKAAKAAKAGATAKTGGKTTKAAASEVRRAPTPDPSGSAGPALNDPLTFLTFVANYPIGSRFDGTVVSFTSHGAHVDVGAMRCHIPLGGLADPAPQKARDVLTKGETRQFELVSLDAARRRAALTLPGIGS